MYGSGMGSLLIQVDAVDKEKRTIFHKTGDQGHKQWQTIKLLIEEQNEFKLRIIGTRGNHYNSDIALDNLQIIPGKICSE